MTETLTKKELQERVKELEGKFVQTEPVRSLGSLAGGVSNRFNNLLSVILGYASYVLNREDLSEESRNALKEVITASQRGRKLTEELMAFAGQPAEDEDRCHVHEIVESAMSILSSQFHSRIRFEAQLNALEDAVWAPPGALWQALFSVLANAAQSLPEGGKVVVSTDSVEAVNESGKLRYLKLVICDNLGALWDVSEKNASGLIDEAAGGSTMNMQMSSLKGLVGSLEGSVSMSVEPGLETCVQVLLPVEEEEEDPQDTARVRTNIEACTIWVVDDDPIFREMCEQVLAEDGHTITGVEDGATLKSRWKEESARPDLLFIDFSMPDFNGLELTEWLRNEGCQAPIVMVSGFSTGQPDIKKVLEFKKTYFLQKPFDFPDLTNAVDMALGESLLHK